MKHKTMLMGSTLAIASALFASATMAGALSDKDKHFVEKAAIGGMAEVEQGQLASQKASNADVRKFGRGKMTREFGRADKRHLGFWRVYGEDFAARLAEGGLEVSEVGHGVSAQDCVRYGIDSDEGFFICTKAASS